MHSMHNMHTTELQELQKCGSELQVELQKYLV